MSRRLSAPLLARKGSWFLGAGLAISLVVGCGSKGDNADDTTVSTGGRGYIPNQGGGVAVGGGSIVYITGVGGNRATGGRVGFGQGGVIGVGGGFVGVGGQIASTSAANCTTGTVGCACYSAGICNAPLTCNSSKICVSNGTTGTGGAPGTGGASGKGGTKATGGVVGVGGVVGTGGAIVTVGGATAAAGGPATGGAPGGAAATGGAIATGGAPDDGGVAETGGAGSTTECSDNALNNPNGVEPCVADCERVDHLVANGASVAYSCDCDTTNHYVCFAGSPTTVACPVSVALEPVAGVPCSTTNGDEFCKLTSTTTTVIGATTTVTTTAYSCVCGASTKLWSCTK